VTKVFDGKEKRVRTNGYEDEWDKTIKILDRQYERGTEKFTRHYKRKYGDPKLPPIWATVEFSTIGNLRRLNRSLDKEEDRDAISLIFGMTYVVFESFMRRMEEVRNACAHHSRIWNRKMTYAVKLPKESSAKMDGNFNRDEHKNRNIYNTILLLDDANLCSGATEEKRALFKAVETLLKGYPDIEKAQMGYPECA
jgi:abortive infection bacteriophage resistance protein